MNPSRPTITLEEAFLSSIVPADFHKAVRDVEFRALPSTQREALRLSMQATWRDLQAHPDGLKGKELASWTQKRGYIFELLILQMLAFEGLAPHPSFYSLSDEDEDDEDDEENERPAEVAPRKRKPGRQPGGEQMDSLFKFESHYILAEARWRKKPSNIDDVDRLIGRLRRRLDGMYGILISATGFSNNIARLVKRNGPLKILLFDGKDIEYALNAASFSEVLAVKLRYAAMFGQPLYPYVTYLDMARNRR